MATIPQFNTGDLSGWTLTLNLDPSATNKPSQPKEDPASFSFPGLGPNGVKGLSVHTGSFYIVDKDYYPKGANLSNMYIMTKTLPSTNKGGVATLKARCSKLSSQYLSVYIKAPLTEWLLTPEGKKWLLTDVGKQWSDPKNADPNNPSSYWLAKEVGKLWNAPFPGKPTDPFTIYKDLSFVVPAGPCQVSISLIGEPYAAIDIYDFFMPA